MLDRARQQAQQPRSTEPNVPSYSSRLYVAVAVLAGVLGALAFLGLSNTEKPAAETRPPSVEVRSDGGGQPQLMRALNSGYLTGSSTPGWLQGLTLEIRVPHPTYPLRRVPTCCSM